MSSVSGIRGALFQLTSLSLDDESVGFCEFWLIELWIEEALLDIELFSEFPEISTYIGSLIIFVGILIININIKKISNSFKLWNQKLNLILEKKYGD